MLIKLLILFFTILIAYQTFLAFSNGNNLIEGLENDTSNALILSQQNAGNIEVLKGRIDGLDGVKARVDTLQQNIDSMQVQIDALVQQQADYATDLAGDEPVEITGTEEATAEDEEEIV